MFTVHCWEKAMFTVHCWEKAMFTVHYWRTAMFTAHYWVQAVRVTQLGALKQVAGLALALADGYLKRKSMD